MEPAESINLSIKSLGVGSAVVIASLIGSNSVTKSLKCASCPRTAAASGPVDALTVCSGSIDGRPLPIKQLKGDEPAESIDLSDKGLDIGSAVIIASLIGSNSVTKSLKCASCPHLCSVRAR